MAGSNNKMEIRPMMIFSKPDSFVSLGFPVYHAGTNVSKRRSITTKSTPKGHKSPLLKAI